MESNNVKDNTKILSSQLTPATPKGIRYGDRYIPVRSPHGLDSTLSMPTATTLPMSIPGSENHIVAADGRQNDPHNLTYKLVIRNEIMGTSSSLARTEHMWLDEKVQRLGENQRVLQYSVGLSNCPIQPATSPSPLSIDSQQLLCAPQKTPRKISKVPFKVLDAPDLQDDFYLNLVDWSEQNVLSVGLGSCVYLWSAHTSQVTMLCNLSDMGDTITSVGWMSKSNHLAIGTNKGEVQLWDTEKARKVRTLTGHTYRVGAVASKSYVLASGSRDRTILLRDVRMKEHYTDRLTSHKQEVCGLKWSPDRRCLASGGNDNKLYVWDPLTVSRGPSLCFSEHQAAVKAIAWSPHQSGLLASGGGTADRCIRFWNTTVGLPVSSVDTGSQVCNLAWSKTSHELVSTHGYSQNQIVIWKYPSMTQVANLT
eukprot:Ihof_evm5s2 gene=Ihof_evmTU5s2